MGKKLDKSIFLENIKRVSSELTGKQVEIGDYLFRHYDKSAFLTINQLAAEVLVSETTVMRFVVSLGYSGYTDFQSDLQKILMHELTATKSKKQTIGSGLKNDVLTQTLQKETENISEALNKISLDEFKSMVNIILGSEKIWIVATRASACLAHYLSFQLGKIRHQVFAPITHGGTASLDRLRAGEAKDLLIAIAFPRYPRETFDIIDFAMKRKMRVAGITDRIGSPLAKLCTPCFFIPIELLNFIDLFSAQIASLAALVSAVADADKTKTNTSLNEFEDFAKQVKLFLGS